MGQVLRIFDKLEKRENKNFFAVTTLIKTRYQMFGHLIDIISFVLILPNEHLEFESVKNLFRQVVTAICQS